MSKLLELGETLYLILGLAIVIGVYVAMYVVGLFKKSKILKDANSAELREGLRKKD